MKRPGSKRKQIGAIVCSNKLSIFDRSRVRPVPQTLLPAMLFIALAQDFQQHIESKENASK